MSEASGNESTRRKQKKNGSSSNLGSGINTPNGPPSRPRSPATLGAGLDVPNRTNLTVQRKPSSIRSGELKRPRPGGAGSGSEGEGAGSGADMSDGSRKRIKIKASQPNSRNVSPGGSRATSPSRDPVIRSARPSRLISQNGPTMLIRSIDPPPLPSLDAVKADIPAGGVTLKLFMDKYKPIISNAATKDPFMRMIKSICRMERKDGETLLIPLP
jgi:hypothetical protein